MKKLNNPFNKLPGYHCFGCSDGNHHGLKMEFYVEGEEVVSTWTPGHHFQGYFNILHGGIQSTLMDEIASWVVFVKVETGGVTSRLSTRFRKPVYLDEGPVKLRARLKEKGSRTATIEVKLYNNKQILCSESEVEYFLLPPDKASESMRYPGVEAFYES